MNSGYKLTIYAFYVTPGTIPSNHEVEELRRIEKFIQKFHICLNLYKLPMLIKMDNQISLIVY